MRRIRSFSLIELLIGIAIIAILAAVAVPNLLEAQTRAKVSRTKADMRSLAQVIEAYLTNTNTYPAWWAPMPTSFGRKPPGTMTYNEWIVRMAGGDPQSGAASLPNFLLSGDAPHNSFRTLTTPTPYIATYPPDPFASHKGCTFSYLAVSPATDIKVSYRRGVGWILWSFGPDMDENKKTYPGDLAPVFAFDVAIPELYDDPYYPGGLIAGCGPTGESFTYDPTNGTVSNGDIWRVRQ